jgi:hypothetical protein
MVKGKCNIHATRESSATSMLDARVEAMILDPAYRDGGRGVPGPVDV